MANAVADRVLETRIGARVGGFTLDVAFETGRGTTAILGPSGAGKTLTLRAIAGLLRPHAGRIALGERTLFDADQGVDTPARRRRIGYVFQEYALFPHLSVRDNLAFGLAGTPRAQSQARVAEMVALLGLGGLEERKPAELSGGQRQRVAVGRALAPSPDLLLLDEPFSALDVPARLALAEEFQALQERVGVPALLVTHDVAEAYALAQRLVVLDGGRVLQAGRREEVFEAPASAGVARLVGFRNIFDGVVTSRDGSGTAVQVRGVTLAASATGFSVGDQVTVGVRGADVRLDDAQGTPAALVRDMDRGTQRGVLLALDAGTLGGIELHVELDHEHRRRMGAELPQAWTVSVPPEAVHVWPRA